MTTTHPTTYAVASRLGKLTGAVAKTTPNNDITIVPEIPYILSYSKFLSFNLGKLFPNLISNLYFINTDIEITNNIKIEQLTFQEIITSIKFVLNSYTSLQNNQEDISYTKEQYQYSFVKKHTFCNISKKQFSYSTINNTQFDTMKQIADIKTNFDLKFNEQDFKCCLENIIDKNIAYYLANKTTSSSLNDIDFMIEICTLSNFTNFFTYILNYDDMKIFEANCSAIFSHIKDELHLQEKRGLDYKIIKEFNLIIKKYHEKYRR